MNSWPVLEPTRRRPRSPGILALFLSCVYALIGLGSTLNGQASFGLALAIWSVFVAVAYLRQRGWAHTALILTFTGWFGSLGMQFFQWMMDIADGEESLVVGWALVLAVNLALIASVVVLALRSPDP